MRRVQHRAHEHGQRSVRCKNNAFSSRREDVRPHSALWPRASPHQCQCGHRAFHGSTVDIPLGEQASGAFGRAASDAILRVSEASVLNEAARADAADPDAAEVGRDAEQMLTLLVAHMRQDRPRLRQEWATRIHGAHLLEAMSLRERELLTTSVYDRHLEVLETGSVEAAQHFARDLSEQIIPQGVESPEVLGIVLQLHDVLARSLFEKYQPAPDLLHRVLDAYQPVASRIATTVAVTSLELARAEIATLNEALRTRTTIGEAIGLLMHEKTLTADAAFAHLVEVSSHTNVKIREIAARMVDEAGARAERADAGVQPPEPRKPRCAMS